MRRGHVPERTCRGCGRKAPKNELLRFALVAGRGLVEDRPARLPGKGIYCCDAKTCRQRLARSKKVVKAD